MVTIEQLDQLLTPAGRTLLDEVRTLAPTPATTIAIATRLRKRWAGELVAVAMEMTSLRERARTKFSRADDLWFTRSGLEQATSETIAGYRAGRFAGSDQVVDLCCGIGGDLLALGRMLPDAALTAVDRDPLHARMAALNAEAYGLAGRVTVVESDVRNVTMPATAGVFIDPARRFGADRMALGESEPALDWCLGLAGPDRPVGIKFAPGIDHARVPDTWELETIALGADLKEAMLWSPALARVTRAATVIEGATIHRLEPVPGDPVAIREPETGDFLLDPNPAVTRAGLVEDLARRAGAARIDDQIAFLVADLPVRSPFARTLAIRASLPWNEKVLRRVLRDMDAGPVDIRRRGLAGEVDLITKRLRGKGHTPYTIAMTRVMDRPWALVCESIPE